MVEQHDPARPHARDLAAQLRADRAARARHEHRLPGQVGAHPVELHLHRLAAEHVLDAHLAHLARDRGAPAVGLQQLEHGRQRAHRNRRARGTRAPPAPASSPGAEGIAMITSSGSASSRMRGRSPSVLPRTLTPSMRRPRLRGSSSRKPDRRKPELAVAQDLAQHEPPAVAGADDQHAALALAHRRGTPPAAGARTGCARARARRSGTAARAGRTARSRRWAAPRPPSRACAGSGARGATPRPPPP